MDHMVLEQRLTNLPSSVMQKELETEFDQLVYKLYGLTPDEISIVEGSK